MKKICSLLLLLGSIVSQAQTASDTTIPVRLKTFQASATDIGNDLHWTVSCFLNYALFEVQRSTDGTHYSTINTFQADNLRCKQPFDYEDKTAKGKIFYRVRVGDLDGKFYNSKIVIITGRQKGLDIAAMYPTIVKSTAIVSITSANNDKAQLKISDLQGKIVLLQTNTLTKGSNDVILDCTKLAKGSYTLAIQNSDSELKTVQFIKI